MPDVADAPARPSVEELTARARRVIASADGGNAEGAPPPPVSPKATTLPPHSHGVGETGPGGERALTLGIDPGTATMGYGLVTTGDDVTFRAVKYGVILTPAGMPMHQRLLILYQELKALIATHHPTEAAVEKLFFGRNTTTAITVGQARGVALLAAAEAGLSVVEYTPAEVKQSMAGFGRADKVQMQRMVQALLALPELPHPDDAADALAIALCHQRMSRLRSALASV